MNILSRRPPLYPASLWGKDSYSLGGSGKPLGQCVAQRPKHGNVHCVQQYD